MTERDLVGELAAAWDIVVRHMANTTEPHDARSMAFGAVLDDFDRQAAVVDAARALVEKVDPIPGSWKDTAFQALDEAEETPELYGALAREVHALDSDGGGSGGN